MTHAEHHANLDLLIDYCDAHPDDRHIVSSAHELAGVAHRYQRRPGPDGEESYMHHVVDVAASLIKHWDTETQGPLPADMVAAALLHDSVEDQPLRLASLREGRFPDAMYRDMVEPLIPGLTPDQPGHDKRVKDITKAIGATMRPQALAHIAETVSPRAAELVSGMTTPPEVSGPDAYAEHLREHIYPDPDLAVLKACDQLGNAGRLHLLPESPHRTKLLNKYAEPTREAQHNLERLGLDSFAAPMAQAVDRIDTLIEQARQAQAQTTPALEQALAARNQGSTTTPSPVTPEF